MSELNHITPAMEHNPLWSGQNSEQDTENKRVKLGFYLLRLVILAGLLVCVLQAGSTV